MRRNEAPAPYYPIFLDISRRKCVVAGGGAVALRKVKALIEHGASVEVISPDFCPELSQLGRDGTISLVKRNYAPGDLKGAFVVIAATDDGEINSRVAEEASTRNVLTNVVDDPQHSDFIVPSYLRRGQFIIAVSTGGMSPALARKVRTRLEDIFGTEYESLGPMIDQVRSELKQKGVTANGDAWQEALDLDLLLPMVKAGRTEEARGILLDRLESLAKYET